MSMWRDSLSKAERLGWILAGLTLVWLSSAAALGAERTPMQLELRLDPATAQLEGRLMLTPDAFGEASLQRFRLHPAVTVERVTLDGKILDPVHTPDATLEIATDPEPAGEELVIEYGVSLPGIREVRPGGGFLGPEGGFLPPGVAWYPVPETPEPHPVRIHLNVTGGQLGVVSGSLLHEERDGTEYRAVFEHPAARRLAVATGNWTAGEVDAGEVRVRTLFPPELEQAFGALYRQHTAAYVERFSAEIGPYPHDSLTVAASPASVGLAFSGFTLLGESVIPLPFIPHTSLGHEVLHMWWGTGVKVAWRGGNWSEGLTTYMADYQFKREAGAAREERGRWLRDYAALPPDEDRAHDAFRGGNAEAQRITGYHRGAMLWAMLEDWIGRETFLAGARNLYQNHRFREADWDAVITAFDAATSVDLKPFFRQWIERQGAPRLWLQDLEVVADEAGSSVRGRLSQADHENPWRLRVPVVVRTATGEQTEWLSLDTVSREFSLHLDERPEAIAVDPDWRLFRQLHADESPAILRRASLNPNLQVIALESAQPEELAPWLGRVPEEARDQDRIGPRVLLGRAEAVSDWLQEQDLPTSLEALLEDVEIRGRPHAWTVPDTDLVVVVGSDAAARRALAAELRHRAHYSYRVVGDEDGSGTGLWPTTGIWKSLAP